MTNREQVAQKLSNHTREDLVEWVSSSHKDFYGVRGRQYHDATRDELITWIANHFRWNEEERLFENTVEFC